MSKKATTDAKPFVPEEGTLPGELPSFNSTDTSTDASMFVAFNEPGDEFTGMFLDTVQEGDHGKLSLEYDAMLYAEYPSGELKLLPLGWSQAEEKAKQEREGRDLSNFIQRTKLKAVKLKDEGTKKEKKVKLFDYGYMPLTEEQANSFRARIHGDDRLTALLK